MTQDAPSSAECGIVPFKVVSTWPVGTFLENIAVRDDGTIMVTAFNDAAVHRVGTDGEAHVVAKLPQPVTGIVVSRAETFVCSGSPGKSPWNVFRISAEKKLSLVAEISEGLLLNGFTPFGVSTALVVDSYLGAIFEVDLNNGGYRTWLQHGVLGKSTDRKVTPGVNGIKCFGDAVFVTNTDSGRLIKIGISRNGTPEVPIVIEENLIGDDFAFDSEGAIYVATHSNNEVLKLSKNGERIIIAGPREGMAGSTACAFGNTTLDKECLYVTTTGGLVSPFEGHIQPAKLVRLEIGVKGHPVCFK